MPQIWVLLQDELLFYCLLYTDCPGGRDAAVARHVSFAQITCLKNLKSLKGSIFRFFVCCEIYYIFQSRF